MLARSAISLMVAALLDACSGAIEDGRVASLEGERSATRVVNATVAADALIPDAPDGQPPLPNLQSRDLPYTPPRAADPALPARVFRLASSEYVASVEAITGTFVGPRVFGEPAESGLFANLSNVNFVRVELAASYYDTAERVTRALTPPQLTVFTGPCGLLTPACKDPFIRGVLSRAYRRPPTADEIAEAGEIFDLAVAAGEPLLPFTSVVQLSLTSPSFLYRTEIGADAPIGEMRVQLTPYEVASLLSYSVLGAPPPPALLDAAARGELLTPASLRESLGWLLDSAAAHIRLEDFLSQWLRLDALNETLFKSSTLFPGFEDVRSAMLHEARAFLRVNGGMDATLERLFTAPVPLATGTLHDFYASTDAGHGDRTGWLALGAFLAVTAHADQSSPTLRGHFVRERLLCQHLTIPASVPTLEALEQSGRKPRSTRELYAMHRQPGCATCHEALDDVGFVFESFDGAGRFRATERFRGEGEPTPVDVTGRLINTDVDRQLANHRELEQALSESAWVRECAATQLFRYAFGYAGDVPRGLPPVTAGYDALRAGATLRELWLSVMSTPTTFERMRTP